MLTTLRSARRALRASALLALLGAAGTIGCGEDPFAPRANFDNANVVFEVWALTGAPTNFPTVHLVAQRITARPDAAASFDLAFDIDPQGRVVVLPVSQVVTPLGGNRTVGMLRSTLPFADIDAAPRSGYTFDSTLVVGVGEPFIVRVQTLFCQTELRDHVFAKYIVDSILPDERRIRISGRVNPNCGFRSFGEGVPKF